MHISLLIHADRINVCSVGNIYPAIVAGYIENFYEVLKLILPWVCDNLTYADLFKLLEEAQVKLGRPMHPTFYSPAEWTRKYQANNNFLTQLVKQPKIFLIGTEDELIKLG